ncbi:hypothetical protein R9C00_18225 [Flammeovirgaceae bacterium SG7u.111]|nr:hypothetical protein [Flammeovirgaceae bacterium SG7u.132]WPO33643.1 hypothetical protein R9C00_18225 [Flammeovirgaceae bacterium SG7u.111]
MSQLSKEDIDFLHKSLVQKEIKYDPLVDEILDHICCEVESLMENGMSFSDAYLRFSKSLKPKALKQLEEETIHLVNYKLFVMKKAIYILASFTASLFFISSIVKIMHWPGANPLIQIDMILFTITFLIWGAYTVKKEKLNRSGKALFPLSTLFVFSALGGAFFKVMHWPGAGILLTVGLAGTALFSVPYFFITSYKETQKG